MIGTVSGQVAFICFDILLWRFSMRAFTIAVLAGTLAIPSVAHAQQDGPVGGKVGSDLGTSTTQQPGSAPSTQPYGIPNPNGHAAGFSGSTAPGQVLPDNVQVTPRQGGNGTAYVNGHRVIVDQSNRILRVIN
jgi:hypothetical protein